MAASSEPVNVVRLFDASGLGTIRWLELAEVLRYTDASVFSDANIARLFDGFDHRRGESVQTADFLHWLYRHDQTPAEPNVVGRHLILHFDINKTIVMMDSATGKSMEDIANHVLALSAWGSVRSGGAGSTGPSAWRCEVASPSVDRPKPGLVSYAEFLEAEFPGQTNKENREQRWHRFTSPGQPGEALRGHCDAFLAALRLPEEVVGTEAARGAGLHGKEVFILPAFFELLLHLKRSRRSFSLVFRTFGTDIQEVATELNAFCEGRHPLFPGAVLDERDGEPDYRIDLNDRSAFGTFFRSSSSGEGDALVYGTLRQPKPGEGGVDFYRNLEEASRLRVVSGGLPAIHRDLRRRAGRPGTLALRDYFPFWRAQGMGSDPLRHNGGKLMVIDPRPSSSVHEVFFDDNIYYTSPRIVDVRHALFPGKVLSIRYLAPCHLVRAEPLESVTDRQYFVRHVERLSAAYERRFAVCARLRSLCRLALQKDAFARARGLERAAGPECYEAASFAEPEDQEASQSPRRTERPPPIAACRL